MPTTTGMKGGGYYNTHSYVQRAALDAFLPWIEDAIADLPLSSDVSLPLGLLDLGSSEGRNAIHAMMRISEILRRRIYEDLIFPVYFRTLEELTAPIEADAELAAAFRIEKKGVREAPALFNLEREKTGDVAVWARSYAGFLRAFTEPILAAAIPAELSQAGIVHEIYRRVEDRLAADPDRYEFHYIALGVLLTRR